jgi:hypothetical protein
MLGAVDRTPDGMLHKSNNALTNESNNKSEQKINTTHQLIVAVKMYLSHCCIFVLKYGKNILLVRDGTRWRP